MVEITIEEIAKDPLTYLHRTQIGESFIVLQAGQPIAQINPIPTQPKMTLANAIAIIQEKMNAADLNHSPDKTWDDWDNVRDRTPVSDEPRW
jgi:antitoxin (DNA-binding transcriptional repressor) of toxin-antitoxin stability system